MMARSAAGIKIDEDEDVRGKAKMKTVISTNDGTGTRSGGRPKGRGGGDQDDDEFDYEEDFQDDEEGIAKIDDLADEEETKELEVSLLSFLTVLLLATDSILFLCRRNVFEKRCELRNDRMRFPMMSTKTSTKT